MDEKRKIHTLRAKGKIEKLKEKLKKYLSTDILELVTLDGQLTEYPLLQMHILIRQTMYPIVHNGIIENYSVLKNKLIKLGYKFTSETDSEVIAHLLDFEKKK